MPLTTGTWLGPYEIVSAIGAGGMGEVYRATDSQWNSSRARISRSGLRAARSRSTKHFPSLGRSPRRSKRRTNAGYDLHPDGQRVATFAPPERASGVEDKVVFLQNFFDELRRRVPLGK